MTRYSPLIIVIHFYLLAATSVFAQDYISLSLKEAVDLAMANNADVTTAKFNMSNAELAIRESKGNFLPKVNLTGNYTRNIDNPVIFLPDGFGQGGATEIGSANNFNGYLDVSVPLYSKYNVTTRNLAKDNFYWQRENLRGTQQIVIANVKKAYFACLLVVEAVRVREKALRNAEENHNNIVHKVAQGIATEYDETSARVRASNFRNELLEAQSQVLPAENRLRLLLGLSFKNVVVLTDSLYLSEAELTIFPTDTALANNSSFRQRELMIKVASQQTTIARTSYFPVLSGAGTYQYQTQQNDFHISRGDWVISTSAGLRLQVPIFNGTINRIKVQRSIINELIAKAQKDYTSRYNEAQFGQIISRLTYLKQRLVVQADNIRLAAKAVELIKDRYQYGRASLLEVNNAELDYVSARLSYLEVIAEYKSAYCDWELLVGK